VEEPFWKRLWTGRESDRILNDDKLEVSGQLHAPAVLPPGKKASTICVDRRAGDDEF
jgi:hypothetical protein